MNIKEIAFTKALNLINASGAEYHILFEGQEYGQRIGKPTRTRKRSKYPLYELRDYVIPVLDLLKQAGDVEVVEIKHYDTESVRSSLGKYAQARFGSGNYMTTVQNDKVQIMRIL